MKSRINYIEFYWHLPENTIIYKIRVFMLIWLIF